MQCNKMQICNPTHRSVVQKDTEMQCKQTKLIKLARSTTMDYLTDRETISFFLKWFAFVGNMDDVCLVNSQESCNVLKSVHQLPQKLICTRNDTLLL